MQQKKLKKTSKKLSDINTCDLTAYPRGTKKHYSGLCGNFIPSKESRFSVMGYKEWEFGFKQKLEKLEKNVYYPYGYHRHYPIWDYDSAFAVFRLISYPANFWNILHERKVFLEEPAYCRFCIDSTDDGEWEVSFRPEYLSKFMRFMIHNYKGISLEQIDQYVVNELKGWKDYE